MTSKNSKLERIGLLPGITKAPWWLMFAVFFLMTPQTMAASFPCTRASTNIEHMICNSKELSELDDYLARYYSGARAALPDAKECLATNQKTWLRNIRNVCKNDACLKKSYLNRLAEFHGVQPGASALKNLPLANIATLVWINPPALDQVAAPRLPNMRSLNVTGKLANEVDTGDGYIIVAPDGKKHLLVPLMFIDDSTRMLDSLIKQTRTNYLARGYAEPDHGNPLNFSSGHCTCVYRLPK